jgi:hypothetical protein
MAGFLAGLGQIGTFLGQAGGAATGVGGLISAFGGGGGEPDYASLYAQLAPGQTQLTTQQYLMGAQLQPWIQAMGAETTIRGQTAYDQFKNSLTKDQTAAGMLAGISSQYASSAIGLHDLAAKGRLAAETLGLETAENLAQTYATAAANLANTTLTGEAQALLPTAQAVASAGQTAQQGKNQLASNIASTNLDIRRQQEQTRNQMALQRAQTEGQLALERSRRSAALGLTAALA